MKVEAISLQPVPGVVVRYHLADDRIVDVLAMTFGKMRIGVGTAGDQWYTDLW